MNITAIGSAAGRFGANFDPSIARMRGGQMDPSKMLDDATKKFIQTNDKDGDGSLSGKEVTSLSKEAFSKIDTNGDAKLSQDEMVATAKNQMEAIRKEFETNGPSGVKKMMESTQASPAGELMKAMTPNGPGSGAPMGMSGRPQSGQMDATRQSIVSAYQGNDDLLSSILPANRAHSTNLTA